MDHTSSIPQQHISSCLLVDVSSEIFIRCKNDRLIFWKTLNYDLRITAGDDHITQGFDTGTAVNVAHHHMIGMLFFKFFEQGGWTTIAKRTTCFEIRNYHFPGWVKDLGCLRHEMYTCKDDHIRCSSLGLLRKTQTVPDVIRYVLDIWFLVVVCKY